MLYSLPIKKFTCFFSTSSSKIFLNNPTCQKASYHLRSSLHQTRLFPQILLRIFSLVILSLSKNQYTIYFSTTVRSLSNLFLCLLLLLSISLKLTLQKFYLYFISSFLVINKFRLFFKNSSFSRKFMCDLPLFTA